MPALGQFQKAHRQSVRVERVAVQAAVGDRHGGVIQSVGQKRGRSAVRHLEFAGELAHKFGGISIGALSPVVRGGTAVSWTRAWRVGKTSRSRPWVD